MEAPLLEIEGLRTRFDTEEGTARAVAVCSDDSSRAASPTLSPAPSRTMVPIAWPPVTRTSSWPSMMTKNARRGSPALMSSSPLASARRFATGASSSSTERPTPAKISQVSS